MSGPVAAPPCGFAMFAILGGVDAANYFLVALVAFLASLVGGIAGYGTGLLLPPVLLPIVGPELVVPVISLSALLTNASRIAAFRADLNSRMAVLLAAVAFPTCLLGAYFYTRLSGATVTLLIGVVLVLIVPLRRQLARWRGHLSKPGLIGAGAGYGVVTGGTSGAGVLLITILLSAGLHGPAVIATNAAISIVLGLGKVMVFQSAGSLPLSAWMMAALIGLCALPGAFVAKRLARRLSHSAHTLVLDGVVILGGILLIGQGLKFLT